MRATGTGSAARAMDSNRTRAARVESGAAGILESDLLAGLEPERLAERFGTPLYVYDLDVVACRFAALRAALPPSFEVAYAVKANPALAVIARLGALGAGADVASAGELAAALRAGIPAARIVVTGPGKRSGELELAVGSRVRAVTVESPGELDRLEATAAALERRTPILLRAAVTDDGAKRVRLIGGDGAAKFGMDRDDLLACGRRAIGSPHLELLGLHAFGASNVLSAAAIVAHVRATLELAAGLARATGLPLRLVDVGGGLGIPYGPDEEPLDLAALGAGLAGLREAWAADPLVAGARVLLEPGRFLVGPAGAYLARVVDRKRVGGADVAILDGGIHHLVRPALTGQEHRIATLGVLGRAGDGNRREPVTVAGPLCTGLDVFGRRADLPPPAVGDLVAILDAGAYGYTESMPLFLSHPMPAEVAVRGGRAELIRPRIEPSELLERQILPAW